MIRLVLAGLWVCILTAGTSYAVAYWKENGSLLPAKDEYLDGLQYQKTRALSVPSSTRPRMMSTVRDTTSASNTC